LDKSGREKFRQDYLEWPDRYKQLDIAAYSHFAPTPIRQGPYSTTAVPFRWLLRESGCEIANLYNLDVDLAQEIADEDWMTHNSWFLNHQNQKAVLDGFFSRVPGIPHAFNRVTLFYIPCRKKSLLISKHLQQFETPLLPPPHPLFTER
jgi:hypothetical protein